VEAAKKAGFPPAQDPARERQGEGRASDKVTREEISSRDHIVEPLAFLPQGTGAQKHKRAQKRIKRINPQKRIRPAPGRQVPQWNPTPWSRYNRWPMKSEGS